VLRAIRHELPEQNLLYLADSAHAPYGDQSAEFITKRAQAMTEFLLAAGSRAVVVACNTATVVAVEQLRAWCPVPVVAIEPAIKPAASATRSGVIAVLATRQTVDSAAVARLVEVHGRDVEIILTACPGLVEQVERAELGSDATRALLWQYLEPLLAAGVDTLVLGCTHYPFLAPLIRDLAGPDILIIDPATAVARQVARRLELDPVAAMPAQPGRELFFSNSGIEQSRLVISALWGQSVEVHAFGLPR
jgi:glutamate racemase